MDKKKSGSYYTPQRLADFVANYCLSKINNKKTISILEPSVGDGAFIKAISKSHELKKFKTIKSTIVEKENDELQKAINLEINSKINLESNNLDYLKFHYKNTESYNLIIGNPPYVKKNHLTDGQKDLAKLIHSEKNLSDKSINNIWTSFLVSGISKLTNDGILAMILPLELLQVKFTEEIRNLLINEFQRMEIFTFNELQFQECKGQDTVLLIGYKKNINRGTYYTNIENIDDLENGKFEFYENTALVNSDRKWTHHFITPEEYEFLENLKSRLYSASHYMNNKAGIVTAANNYFIVNNEVIEKYNLQDYAKPIVQKGFFVNGSVTFNLQNFQTLIDEKKPTFLLDFNSLSDDDITPEMEEYFNYGIEQELHLRFKCKQRDRWYKVPNISTIPQAFFFKRAHEYPKLLRNDANVLVTDSAYKIEIKEEFNLNNFIFSFYNSLTLAFAELEGRYYGGGVLELTPNELRVLPIPYTECNDFEEFTKNFKNKTSIKEILERYNYQILNETLNLTTEEISNIERIRQKLINKRHRN